MSALFTKEPSQIKLSTLVALCTALECTPNDLFDIDTTPVTQANSPKPAKGVVNEAQVRGGPLDAADLSMTRRNPGLSAVWPRGR